MDVKQQYNNNSKSTAHRPTLYTIFYNARFQHTKRHPSDHVYKIVYNVVPVRQGPIKRFFFTKLCTMSYQYTERPPSDVVHKIMYNVATVRQALTKRCRTQFCTMFQYIQRPPSDIVHKTVYSVLYIAHPQQAIAVECTSDINAGCIIWSFTAVSTVFQFLQVGG